MPISRADRSRVAEWWFTVDRQLLAAILALIGLGLVVSLAASPAVALKKGLPSYYFVERHVIFAAVGGVVVLGISLLGPRAIRRLCLLMFGVALATMLAALLSGEEINGARRWLRVAGWSLQPSEFAKPAFVVLSAWAFVEARRRADMPARAISITLYLTFAALLVLQPDVGQALLVTLVWATLSFVAGQPAAWALAVAALGAVGLGLSYATLAHVRLRIDRFLVPAPGDRSQGDRALQSFTEGGFFGRGPGEGVIKTVLPDAHTDFIFAVIAEEYGVVACLALLALFGFIVLRTMVRVAGEPDLFTRHAATGLALIFGLQALINMSVNVGLLPAKGLTLPFISAGGSSTLAVAITLGMVLALTRRRPRARFKAPPWAGASDRLGPAGSAMQ